LFYRADPRSAEGRSTERPARDSADAGASAAASLRSLVRRQELFARRVHEPRLDPGALATSRGCWMGLGIASNGISRGLPVDVLGLLYALEMVRRDQRYAESRVLVADANAMACGVPNLDVQRQTSRVFETLGTIIDHLGFPVTLFRASELASRAEMASLTEGVQSDNAYVRRQVAQTEAMRRRGFGVKVGWSMRGMTWDERRFDDAFARHFRGVSFVYTTGGRTLDPRRTRACPYLCADRTVRLVLDPTERVEDKLADANSAAVRGVRRLLGKLARAHRHLTGSAPDSPEALAQSLIDVLPRSLSGGTRTGARA
jgi:hypothetical protein